MTMNTTDVTSDDIPDLQKMLEATGLFPPEMLPGLFTSDEAALWLAGRVNGRAVGLLYAVPEAMTEATWNMRALGIAPECQRLGLGTQLVRSAEERLRQMGQRLLIVDTSGLQAFEPARSFYSRCGYEQVARIADFWAEGDDKVTFRKAL